MQLNGHLIVRLFILIFPHTIDIICIIQIDLISQHFPMLIWRIHIKQKNTAGFCHIENLLKNGFDIRKRIQMIQAIQCTDRNIHCSVQVQFSHILTNILNRQVVFELLLHCLIQHSIGIVNTQYIIAQFCKFFRKTARSASQIQQYNALRLAVFLNQPVKIGCSLRIFHIFCQLVVIKRKCLVSCFHSNASFL